MVDSLTDRVGAGLSSYRGSAVVSQLLVFDSYSTFTLIYRDCIPVDCDVLQKHFYASLTLGQSRCFPEGCIELYGPLQTISDSPPRWCEMHTAPVAELMGKQS